MSDVKAVKTSDLVAAGINFDSFYGNIPYVEAFESLPVQDMQNLSVSTSYDILCKVTMTDSSAKITKGAHKQWKNGTLVEDNVQEDTYGRWKTGETVCIILLNGFKHHTPETDIHEWCFYDDSGNKSNVLSYSYVLK